MDLAPLAPRPEYLPRPVPIPWPIRCRFCFWPFGGRRLLRFISCTLSARGVLRLRTRLSMFVLLTILLRFREDGGPSPPCPGKLVYQGAPPPDSTSADRVTARCPCAFEACRWCFALV